MIELTLSVPTRCVTALLTMVLPAQLPLSIGREDDTRSTNAKSSPAATIFWALKAHALLDWPLPAGRAGGKDSKCNCDNYNGAKLDHAPDWYDPFPPPPPSGGAMAIREVGG